MILCEQEAQFKKELKKLTKKYKSLKKDLETFKLVLNSFPKGNSNRRFHTIKEKHSFSIIKARLYCSSLKRDSLRIIYAYHEEKKKIYFIELYFKGDRENHDEERIKNFLSST